MSNDVSRRNFLKGASALGAAGVVATTVPGCSGARSPASNPTSAGVTVPPPPVLEAGTWQYEPDLFRITLNLGDVPLAGCAVTDGNRTFKVRALFNDMMYWAVEGSDSRLYLQQWVRTSASLGGTPSMAGTWENGLGHTLTLTETTTDQGTTAVSQTGGCAGYGYLGQTALENNIFQFGVAAGDPSDDGFILWTRAPKDGGLVDVRLEVSPSPLFDVAVYTHPLVATTGGNVGTDDADATHGDHIIKIDLTGNGTFLARTTYYYRFTTPSENDTAAKPFVSQIGRVKTLPEATDSAISSLRLALVSCSSFPHGFFNAYRQAARHDDLDGVMHMGDYIYEYPGADAMSPGNSHDYPESGAVRMYESDNQVEMVTLDQYRRRFRDYRRDIDLQLIHSRYWFINTWDDHETANDSFDGDEEGPGGGAENHNDTSFHSAGYTIEATTAWNDRKANAAQAYNEWLPIADIKDPTHGYLRPQLYRNFSYGKLAEIIVLDTRVSGREEPILDPNGAGASTYDDARRLMSVDQFNFMTGALTDAQSAITNGGTTTWKLLAQQIMMGHLVGPPLLGTPAQPGPSTDLLWNSVINPDQWDGYNDEREKLFAHIMPAVSAAGPTPVGGIENFICLTGDIHTSWAIELVDDPRKRAPSFTPVSVPVPASQFYGVEFVTPSITSPGLPDPGGALTTSLQTNNQHIKYSDLVNRGFSILEVTPAETSCTWYHVTDATIADVEDETVTLAKKFKVAAGQRSLTEEAV